MAVLGRKVEGVCDRINVTERDVLQLRQRGVYASATVTSAQADLRLGKYYRSVFICPNMLQPRVRLPEQLCRTDGHLTHLHSCWPCLLGCSFSVCFVHDDPAWEVVLVMQECSIY
jgi:hypothetical protein